MSLDIGEFGRSTCLSLGDPYNDKPSPPRGIIKGKKQFLTRPARSGLAATFGDGYYKVNRIFEGDSIESMDKLNAHEKLKSREKFLVPYGFKPSSPAKRLTGPGSYDGLFTTCQPLGPSECLKRDEIPPKPQPQPKNFKGGSTKKGSYGTVGTTIAPLPEYVADPYDSHRLEMQKKAIAELNAEKGRKPFVSTCQSVGRATLDVPEHGRTTAGKLFQADPAALPPRTFPEDEMNPKQVADLKKQKRGFEQDFIPAKGPKSGIMGTIDPFPAKIPDPFDQAAVRDSLKPFRLFPDAVRKKNLPEALAARKPLKPSSGFKTGVTPSIAKMSISKSAVMLGR